MLSANERSHRSEFPLKLVRKQMLAQAVKHLFKMVLEAALFPLSETFNVKVAHRGELTTIQ